MIKRNIRSVHMLLFFLIVPVLFLSAQEELSQKLTDLPAIVSVEALESNHFPEKYVVRVEQPLDHQAPEKGSFNQRVVISHRGFDCPTVMVTEGYGGSYALSPNYQDELSVLFNTNIVFVEHRYFLESTPEPLDWQYLTAQNSAYDLHHVNGLLKTIYPGKWISTGISKGGQTATLYRAFFPDDVDISVPYVAPLNRAVEDPRHLSFLEKVGTKAERKRIKEFQIEVLKRKADMLPLLEEYNEKKQLTYRISPEEVLDYAVLEYPFALWQWGTSVNTIPSLDSDDKILFEHLLTVSGPDYFSEQQSIASFFVQAARELGYYPYDTKPFRKYLTIPSAGGYLEQLMLPEGVAPVTFSDQLYQKIMNFLENNDSKMIFIYGEYDPWSATRVPDLKGKKNLQIYIEPKGSHRARIRTMPDATQKKIIDQINSWLEE